MQLQEVLRGVSVTGSYDPALEIADIAYDSRKAKENTLFVCLTGARTDGHIFAKNAYDTGCRIFLCEKPIDVPADAVVLRCENTRAALAVLSCNFFCHPCRDIMVIGITGTKGKTTTAHIVKAVLDKAGVPTGIIGTVGAAFKDTVLPTVNTTPESYELQKLLRMMADAGCKAAAIEVSSLGLKFHRVMVCGLTPPYSRIFRPTISAATSTIRLKNMRTGKRSCSPAATLRCSTRTIRSARRSRKAARAKRRRSATRRTPITGF